MEIPENHPSEVSVGTVDSYSFYWDMEDWGPGQTSGAVGESSQYGHTASPRPENTSLATLESLQLAMGTIQDTPVYLSEGHGNAVASNNPSADSSPRARIRPLITQDSVRVLRRWYATNKHHPYPSKEAKETLSSVTGLDMTQITNWFANARRRAKAAAATTRPSSTHNEQPPAGIDIPPRHPTPGIFESMDPLQRWANSPPEDEPASASAISRAINAADPALEPQAYASPAPRCSGGNSSASLSNRSSASRYHELSSDGSIASTHSSASGIAPSTFPIFRPSLRRRRRRKQAIQHRQEPPQQSKGLFQCTFCTEEFRTKYDWQRHEKTWHLPLDRWVCAPTGPLSLHPDTNALMCVFCGKESPDAAHIESHNFSLCNRRKEGRTFYRKDHLMQHLRLVHHVSVPGNSFDSWKVSAPQIRSRCGFCGRCLDDWSMRVEHLGEHFRTGSTMENWRGDWGFEPSIISSLENALPPYLLHYERNSPLPYKAGKATPWTPSTAYELLKMELQYWIIDQMDDVGRTPSDSQIQEEACRIILSADLLSSNDAGDASSWLRDLAMSSTEIMQSAMFQTVRGQAESRLSSLRINGKDNIFQNCNLESQLQDFYVDAMLHRRPISDSQLQSEAARIIRLTEELSNAPSEVVASWLLRLISSCTEWLGQFKQRAAKSMSPEAGGLPRELETLLPLCQAHGEHDNEPIASLQNFHLSPIEVSMGALGSHGPSSVDQAGFFMDPSGGMGGMGGFDELDLVMEHAPVDPPNPEDERSPFAQHPRASLPTQISDPESPRLGNITSTPSPGPSTSTKRPPYFPNDGNAYRRLARDLARFVASAMSEKNPNKHVPTDEEIKYQARWLEFDDDDPWNQTAADNPEWLLRFKRDVGLLPPDSGPSLGLVQRMIPKLH